MRQDPSDTNQSCETTVKGVFGANSYHFPLYEKKGDVPEGT